MSAYIDPMCHHGWILRGRATASCHLIADTLEELHRVAEAAGCRRAWYQAKSHTPHYDLTESRRRAAIAAGAIPCDRRVFVGHMRRIRVAR